ncbi:hypothetical protein LBW12_10495 [Latilactobacillus curvatus]|uniref:hypothetical protein n=1 Tax=Latilactobacillus curvatus TaxID=28038 RepID=UPI0020C7F5DC|nr:hypothetical protein [Latilactobacillus curvatus]MCP8860363.1 hypothetical protein [Latilactobacillus curvatus]
MSIITRDELINAYKDEVNLLEMNQYRSSNVITLNIGTVSEFIKLAKELKINHVYYNYLYYSIDNYLIPLDTYDEFSDEINIEVKKHNELIDSLDFSKPKQLTLLIVLNGTIMEITLNHFWIKEIGISDNETKHSEIQDKFFKDFKLQQEETSKNEHDDKNRLKEYILSDNEFSYMKNQRLRQDYLCDLLSKDKFEKFNYLFEGDFDRGISIPIKHYMDRIWQEYKEIRKK